VNVEIIPNRRQIDNKFPVLGFTIKTGGLPFYEVILTTNRELFAPQNSAHRNKNNFYSSRQEKNQLEKVNQNDPIYFVPPTVLNNFALGKPSDIFFTLIAYQDEQGNGGIASNNIESLHYEAQSVSISQNFTGQTLSKVLGIFTDYSNNSANSYNQSAYQFSQPFDYQSNSLGENDEGEGEDGYSLMKSVADSFANEDENNAEDGYEFYQNQSSAQEYENYAERDNYSNNHYMLGDYEDGYESEIGELTQNYSEMQESIFPAGSSEPETLYQEDGEFYGEESHSQSFSAEPSFEYAGVAAGVSSNGYQHKNNGHHNYQNEDYGFQTAFDDYDDGFGESYGEALEEPQKSSFAKVPLIGEMIDAGTNAIKKGISVAEKIIAKKRIIDIVAKAESGGNPFKAINADQEFANAKWNKEAYGKWHIGLSYGIVQFTQDGGALGKLLVLMRERDKAKFDEIFGNKDVKIADELIRVTTAKGDSSRLVYKANPKGNGRSVRVQPVDGADLWVSPWKERFELAGDHPPFQAAQNQLAATAYFDPMIQFCQWLGLDTDRAYGMCYDRSVNMGDGSARKWIIGVIGPISTDALRTQALTALGKSNIEDFQKSMGLKTDGWGPMTHSAMVSELKKLGTKSPIPIPTREQMMDSMVRAAAGKDWEKRMKNLRNSTEFTDTVQTF
jgi:hypothetical protein